MDSKRTDITVARLVFFRDSLLRGKSAGKCAAGLAQSAIECISKLENENRVLICRIIELEAEDEDDEVGAGVLFDESIKHIDKPVCYGDDDDGYFKHV